MTTESLVESLVKRGILLEPDGTNLAVEPVERLEPTELEQIRERKAEILSLFKAGCFVVEKCPGDESRAELTDVVKRLAELELEEERQS